MDKIEVCEAFSHPKKSVERKRLLIKLTDKGNFLKNMHVWETGEGEMIPKKRPAHNVLATDYLPCENCRATFSRKTLEQHAKTYMPTKERKKHPIQSRSACLLPVSNKVSNKFRLVLNGLQVNKIGMIMRQDSLITQFGSCSTNLEKTTNN